MLFFRTTDASDEHRFDKNIRLIISGICGETKIPHSVNNRYEEFSFFPVFEIPLIFVQQIEKFF